MIQGLWGGPQRVPVGDLILRTVGKIESCEMRQDLWNAEVTGTLNTDKGQIVFSTFTHADQMVQVIVSFRRGCVNDGSGGLNEDQWADYNRCASASFPR